MLNLFRYVGLRHLKFRPVRTALTSLGVALGVALYVAIRIINVSTLDSFKESMESVAGKASLVVTAGEAGFPESKLDIIEKVPGVAHAVPMVETRAYFAGRKATESLTILGVDLLKEQSVRTYKTTDEETIEDPLTFLNQPDSVILTHSFAQAHHLKIDDKINIATAQGSKRLVVRGLLTPEGPAKAFGGAMAIMDIDGAQMTFGKENKLDRVDIVVAPDQNVDAMAAKISSSLGPGYEVQRPEVQAQGMGRLVQSYQAMLSFTSLLALLVGLFFVTNSVSISVAERRREIGTLRALGATQKGILILFITEAVSMGLIGSIFGVFIGRGLATVLINMVTQSLSLQYLTPIKATHLVFGASEIVTGLVAGTAAAGLAALWPSLKATWIQPLEAMKRADFAQLAGKMKPFARTMVLGLLMMVYLKISSDQHWVSKSKILEYVDEIFGVLGPALLGPGLVALLVMALRRLAGRFEGTIARLAQDNLLQNPKRTASNVTTLMVGLILVIIIAMLNVSFKGSISNWFNRVLRSDILVSSYGSMVAYQVQPISADIGKKLETVPGVLMGPKQGAYGLRFLHFQYQGKQLGIKAWDEPDPKDHFQLFDVRDRSPEKAGYDLYHYPPGQPTVLVSENFVLHFHKKTGDTMTIDTPSGPVPFKIVGVITDYASPEGILYMDRRAFSRYWHDDLVDAFGLSAAPGYTPAQIRKEIDGRFGQKYNLMTLSNYEMRDQVNQNIDESFTYTRAIEGAALLVALLSLLNTFLISVMERTRELGMLRAVGMNRKQMTGLIIQEALVQGGFGAVVAVVLGTIVGHLWVTGSLSYTLGWIIHFYFPWAAVVTTFVTGILVTLAAGAYPAWRAAHVEIREALEYE